MDKYIIHYPNLIERKKYIESLNLNSIIWVSKFLKDHPENFLNLYDNNINAWLKKCKNFYLEIPSYRQLTLGEISCALNHFHAWQLFYESKKEIALFMEDDIIFKNKYIEKSLEKVSYTIPQNSDVIFIAGGFKHNEVSRTIKIKKPFHLKSHPSTNTVCGYMLMRNSAQKLIENFKSISMPIDFELNYIFDLLNFVVYHHIPYLAIEGTCNGFYQSSQSRLNTWGPFKVNLNS